MRGLREPQASAAAGPGCEGRKGGEGMRAEEGKGGGSRGGGRERRGRGRGGAAGDAPLRRARLAFLSFRTAGVSASLPGAGGEGARPTLVRAAAAAMWPPDPDPEPDPEPAGRSAPGAGVPGLRALLPARAFLCSLKGRLLLAESVSAARPRGGAPRGAGAPVRRARRTPPGAPSSWANSPAFRTDSL